jgi:hypothetical protein
MPRTLGEDVSKIVATLAELCGVQGDARLTTLLQQSEFELEQTDYDNWNGGTYTYALHLKVSPRQFAELGDSVSVIEKQLLEKLKLMTRAYSNEFLGSVIITLSLDAPSHGNAGPPLSKEPAFWRPGHFKLFISHISAHKDFASKSARGLRNYGITGFVAHEDIEPTKDWADEIILALNTMDALLALLTPGFETSNWTDQEVGVAIGRGALVVPVRMGLDPYGFMARFQAFTLGDKTPPQLATEIVRILAAHPQTSLKMAHGLVTAFEEAASFADAKTTGGNLSLITAFPKPLRDRVRLAVQENSQIKDSWGVSQRVTSILAKFE